MMDYNNFILQKSQAYSDSGFKPIWMPDFLFDFQKYLVEWALKKGRCALFEDCGLGKGQPYGSKILTDKGWVKIEKLTLKNKIISSNGNAYKIKGIYPKSEIDTYRFHYSDAISQVFDEEHLHICRTNNDRQRNKPFRVLSTKELLNINLRYGKNQLSRNYDIPIVSPINFKKKELSIKPYLLGVLVGDGHLKGNVSISSNDNEILEKVGKELPKGLYLKHKNRYDYRIITGITGAKQHSFRKELKDLGLLNKLSPQKFIPKKYLFSDIQDRLELLKGLMDTDGHIMRCGTCQFYSVSEKLINDVRFIIQSLGGIPTLSKRKTSYKKNGIKINCKDLFTLTFSLKTFNPFYLKRKAVKWNKNPRDNGRWIEDIKFEKKQKTICISVDSPDQSYITENCIVTHNTPQFLVWAENIVRKTNKNVLILTPLAVSHQTILEGEKFGIEVKRSRDGRPHGKITVTNYQQLEKFDFKDYIAVVCDESSILKNFNGKTKKIISEFLKKIQYRLLCTATPSPNDYPELGTSSEALGYMGHVDMLTKYFKNDQNSISQKRFYGNMGIWRFKGHAEIPFWKWMCSWARAIRKPSDIGFSDNDFLLPDLLQEIHIVKNNIPFKQSLFTLEAITLDEQREERKITLTERCEKVKELTRHNKPYIAWCHMNSEGDYLEKILDDAVQVSGGDTDENKESKFLDFEKGNIRGLITKPKIGAWGLNFQHCSHQTLFPSHSFEQFYQCIRRSWRYGQKNKVKIDIVSSEGERMVLKNLQRKELQAEKMFSKLIYHMKDVLQTKDIIKKQKEVIPSWL